MVSRTGKIINTGTGPRSLAAAFKQSPARLTVFCRIVVKQRLNRTDRRRKTGLSEIRPYWITILYYSIIKRCSNATIGHRL